jgi:hypothetical protein
VRKNAEVTLFSGLRRAGAKQRSNPGFSLIPTWSKSEPRNTVNPDIIALTPHGIAFSEGH